MLPTFGPNELRLMAPISVMESEGSPTGDCGLELTSFQCHPAPLKRASLSRLGEKVWFQIPEYALLICE